MDVNQISDQTSELNSFFERYGYPVGLSIALCFIIIYLAWTFLVKRIERMAEDVSERTLKKYQAEIDKDVYKFQTKHQKQIDAIHEVYQKLQTLSGLLHFVMKGEPFTQPMNSSDQLNNLILCRHDFKHEYKKHHLVFGFTLQKSIDEFILAVDDFITGFESGLMPLSPPSIEDEEPGDGLYIAGIWKHGELEDLIERVDKISVSIEKEFRGIFGTGE